jgi:2-phosphosulfolactate phosphatase
MTSPTREATMAAERPVLVHLLPSLVPTGALAGAVAVVIDVLRATTVIVHALAAGGRAVIPCGEINDAKAVAATVSGKVLLTGERQGAPIPGFDLGNSPGEFSAKACKNATVVVTTTNGTRALLRAVEADRVLVAAFVNFSAVCEQLRAESRPVHIVCSGTDGAVSLEDTLLAGAFVDCLSDCGREVKLNDAARLAWDCFENHGCCLAGALEVGAGGERLRSLGYDADIRAAADVDRFAIVPELRRDPLRIERGCIGMVKGHWPR